MLTRHQLSLCVPLVFPRRWSHESPGDDVFFLEMFILGPHFFFRELLIRQNVNKVLTVSALKHERGNRISEASLNVVGSATRIG